MRTRSSQERVTLEDNTPPALWVGSKVLGWNAKRTLGYCCVIHELMIIQGRKQQESSRGPTNGTNRTRALGFFFFFNHSREGSIGGSTPVRGGVPRLRELELLESSIGSVWLDSCRDSRFAALWAHSKSLARCPQLQQMLYRDVPVGLSIVHNNRLAE